MEIIGTDVRPLHRRALELTTALVDRIGRDDLGRDTPCPPWDLAALLGHLVGQNHGFAAAVAGPDDAPVAAFAPRVLTAPAARGWRASAARVAEAFAGADLTRPVLLVEISQELRFPAGLAVGFHLLDTVVHGWDVAASLGLPFRPDDELVTAVLALARLVPAGPERDRPGAAFAPVLPSAPDDGDDAGWPTVLRLLGREPRAGDLATDVGVLSSG